LATEEGSPDLKIGVTLDIFQLSGTFACLRDKLNISVSTGEIVLAVSRSIRLDTPSGPEAVFNLYDDKKFKDFTLGATDIRQNRA